MLHVHSTCVQKMKTLQAKTMLFLGTDAHSYIHPLYKCASKIMNEKETQIDCNVFDVERLEIRMPISSIKSGNAAAVSITVANDMVRSHIFHSVSLKIDFSEIRRVSVLSAVGKIDQKWEINSRENDTKETKLRNFAPDLERNELTKRREKKTLFPFVSICCRVHHMRAHMVQWKSKQDRERQKRKRLARSRIPTCSFRSFSLSYMRRAHTYTRAHKNHSRNVNSHSVHCVHTQRERDTGIYTLKYSACL